MNQDLQETLDLLADEFSAKASRATTDMFRAKDAHSRHEDMDWNAYLFAQGQEDVYARFLERVLLIRELHSNHLPNLQCERDLAAQHADTIRVMLDMVRECGHYEMSRHRIHEGRLNAMKDIATRYQELLPITDITEAEEPKGRTVPLPTN